MCVSEGSLYLVGASIKQSTDVFCGGNQPFCTQFNHIKHHHQCEKQMLETFLVRTAVICSSCPKVSHKYIFDVCSFRFGRKKVVFLALAAQCIAVLLQSFSTSWRVFCIMFLFIGASQISLYISAFVLGITRKSDTHLLCHHLSSPNIFYFVFFFLGQERSC